MLWSPFAYQSFWPASVCADGPELCAQMTRPPHFACMCFLLRSPLLLKPSFFLPQILMSFWGSEILKVRLCISFGAFVFVLMVSGALVTLLIYQCLVCEDSGRAWKDTRAPPPFQALQSWALNLASKYVDCWIYAYGMMHICEHLVKQVLVPHRCLIYNLLDAIAFRHKQTWCLKMANNVNTQGFSGLDTGPVQERLTLVFFWVLCFSIQNPPSNNPKSFIVWEMPFSSWACEPSKAKAPGEGGPTGSAMDGVGWRLKVVSMVVVPGPLIVW